MSESPEAALSARRSFVQRLLGAARLDADVYEEVEADRDATWQAFVAVVLSALAAGVGTISNHGVHGILIYAVVSVALWWVWAGVTWWIGTHWLPTDATEADHGELLRTIGFSSAPGLAMLFCLIDAVDGWIFLGCLAWMWVAMVVAVRQALDYSSTLRALAVCAIGFPVYGIGLLITILMLGPWPI